MSGLLAVIPARGGSKRIPRKNIRAFAGRPMIAYPIAAALESGLFDEVLVSTDDDEIAEVARAAGAAVPFLRPPELSDDHTGTHAVVRHALHWRAQQGRAVELACCIYATAPFLRAQDLHAGLDALRASPAPYAFSVTSYAFPVQRALRRNAQGVVTALYPEHEQTRSQDLEEGWHDAGQFYWGRASAFEQLQSTYASGSIGVPIPRARVQDIDTPEDWERAELMYRALQI